MVCVRGECIEIINRRSNEVPNLGLGPKWDQSPNLVPKKSQFCMQVPNFFVVVKDRPKNYVFWAKKCVFGGKKWSLKVSILH